MKSTSAPFGINRRLLLTTAATLSLFWGPAPPILQQARAQTDPLPSWNDGASKQAITDFVARVTQQGGADFVPLAERIATFDNDGTLWVEHPMYIQLAFALDRVKAMALLHPEWRDTQPFKAALEGDLATLAASGDRAIAVLVMATHAGMTSEEFQKIVTDWLAAARHPKFKRPYTDLSYQPMIELLGYLRGNGFKTYIVSGGGVEFMRPWTERVYGVPPEQSWAPRSRPSFRCATASRSFSVCRRRISSMTGPASRSVSMSSSGPGRSRHSAIPTATSKCCNGRRCPAASALASWSITPMRNANMPTTATHPSVASTRLWMPRRSITGSWST